MQVQELVSARVPAATFYGHPRPKYIPAPARNRARAGARVSHAATHDARRWTPEPLEEPERPPKGAFTVSVNGRVVASTGPEVSTPSPPSPPSPPAAPGCCLPACAEAGAGRRAPSRRCARSTCEKSWMTSWPRSASRRPSRPRAARLRVPRILHRPACETGGEGRDDGRARSRALAGDCVTDPAQSATAQAGA